MNEIKNIIDSIRLLLEKLEKQLNLSWEPVKPIRKKRVFTKPTIDEIQLYCTERKNSISAEIFYNYYEANGWKIGRNKMVDWKATIRNRELKDKQKKEKVKKTMSKEEFEKWKKSQDEKNQKPSSLFTNIIHNGSKH